MASTSDRIFGLLRSFVSGLLSPQKNNQQPPTRPSQKNSSQRPGAASGKKYDAGRAPHAASSPAAGLSTPYVGDFKGKAQVIYSPKSDGAPDPGEIVWTWVPYEEDYSQGKDRPVLLVGRTRGKLLALMLTSKDHLNDRRGDNDYLDIGTGSWDRQGRPSEVKLDRILQVNEADVRREGAILDAVRFADVASGLRQRHGWS